jgi:2EXR family
MFCKLSQELRLKIWEMASEQPRVVVAYKAKREDGKDIPPSFFSLTLTLAVLDLCAESHGIALTKYKPSFMLYVMKLDSLFLGMFWKYMVQNRGCILPAETLLKSHCFSKGVGAETSTVHVCI